LYKVITILILVYSAFFIEVSAEEIQSNAVADDRLNEKIGEINHLSVTQNLDKALKMTKILVQQYPENKLLQLLHAKLLFWDHQPEEAKKVIEKYRTDDEALYQRIYTSWALNELKKRETPEEKLVFIQGLENFAKESYGILWVEIQSALERDDLKLALSRSAQLVSHYPESREAQEQYATLLFWNKKYKKSLECYRRMGKEYHTADYSRQIQQLEQLLHTASGKTEAVVKRRQKIKKYTGSDDPENVTVKKKKKPVEPEQMDKKHLAEYMTGVGIKNADYSDNRYKDRTKYLEMTLPINEYTLYLKIEDTDRYGLNDKKIYGEFYPKLPDPQWGYLSFSYTPDADFLSRYSIGWHHFYGWMNWQFGAGYDWSRYQDEDISLLSAECSYYFSEYLFGRQVVYFVPDNHSWALKSELKYQTPWHLEWYIDYIASRSNEEIGQTNLLKGTDINQVEVGGEYLISEHFTVGGSIGKAWMKDDNYAYTRTQLNAFVRVYW